MSARSRLRTRALGLLGLASLLWAAAARAAPDVPDADAALGALAGTPLRVAGDAVGGAGLVSAAALGLAGDAVALLDDNRVSRVVLRGFASGLVDRLALGVSWTGTGVLEGLRAEDIERLPESMATYLEAAPGLGHLDTLFSGLMAFGLGVRDAVLGPTAFALYATGFNARAQQVETRLDEARTRALGPLAPQ
jgi:hypothetical protein